LDTGVSLLIIISEDTYSRLNLTIVSRRLNVRSGHPQDDEWPLEKWREVLEGARVGFTEKKEAEDCLSSPQPKHGTSRDISL